MEAKLPGHNGVIRLDEDAVLDPGEEFPGEGNESLGG